MLLVIKWAVFFCLFVCLSYKKRVEQIFSSLQVILCQFVTEGHRCCSTFIKYECKLLCNMAVMLYIL